MVFKQNLQGATGGTIQGAHGGTQQLGAAAQRRLQPSGQTPPIMDPAQKPPVPAWQQLAAAGIGGQGSAAANRALAGNPGGEMTKPAVLPGFQPAPGGPNVFHPTNPAAGLDGDQVQVFGAAGRSRQDQQQQGAPNMSSFLPPDREPMQAGANPEVNMMGGENEVMQHLAGRTGAGNPLPGFTFGANGGPLMSMPGSPRKFPPRPGLPTKPLPAPAGGISARPAFPAGGAQLPRNNMAPY